MNLANHQHHHSQHQQHSLQSFRRSSSSGQSPVLVAAICATSAGSPSSSIGGDPTDCHFRQLASYTASVSGPSIPPLALSATSVSASQSSLPPILEEQTESAVVATVTSRTTMMTASSTSNDGTAVDDCGSGGVDSKSDVKSESCKSRGCCFCIYCERRDSDCPEMSTSSLSSSSNPRWRDVDLHGIRCIVSASDNSSMATKDNEAAGARLCSVGIFRRTFWIVLMIVNLTAFAYSVTECVLVYFNVELYHVVFGSTSDIWRTPSAALPALTVCNLNSLRLTELAKRRWPSQFRDWSLDGRLDPYAWTSINVSSWDVFNSTGHQLDELLISCHAGRKVPCSRANFTRHVTSFGVCHTLRPNVQVTRLQLVFNVEGYEYTDLNDGGFGLFVTFHDSDRDIPLMPELLRGIQLAAGTHARINVRHSELTNRQRTPRNYQSSSSSSSGAANDLFDCMVSCRSDVIERRCGCRPFWTARLPKDVTSVSDEFLCHHDDGGSSSASSCRAKHPFDDVSIEWDYSHTDLLSRRTHHHMISPHIQSTFPYSSSHLPSVSTTFASIPASGLPPTVISGSRMAEMAEARCRAGDASARSSREISRRDIDEMSTFGRSLDAVSSRVVDRLQADFGQTMRGVATSLDALRRRLEFHTEVALAGVRRAFVTWFANEFDAVRERGLTPLVAGSHETVIAVEQTIKQLTFTPSSEVVARKVMYYVADSQLSGKLETAIKVLENVTKVYYSFLNAEPLAAADFAPSATASHRSDRRYDSQLIPYKVMAGEHDAMKRHYNGLSENIAGLIGNILIMKTMLKEALQSQSTGVNETFEAEIKSYVVRIQQIKYYTSQFQKQVIEKIMTVVDERINKIQRLNATVSTVFDDIAANVARQRSIIGSSVGAAYNGLLAFVRLTGKFTASDAAKSSLCETGLSDETRSSMTSLMGSLTTLRRHATDLRPQWLRLTDLIRSVWNHLLHDDLVRSFYLALYNDAADPNTGDIASAQGRDGLPVTAAVDVAVNPSPDSTSGKRTGLDSPSSVASGSTSSGQSESEDRSRSERAWLPFRSTAPTNADIPVIDAGSKLSEVTEELKRYAESTDVNEALAGADRELESAYGALRRNLDSFRVDHCESSTVELINNVRTNTEVDPNAKRSSGTQKHPHPDYSPNRNGLVNSMSQLSQIGGLMAFFFGASVLTIFQLVHLLVFRCCSRRAHNPTASTSSSRNAGSKSRNRKRNRRKTAASSVVGTAVENSHHVFFRPVEYFSGLTDESNGLDMTSLHGGGNGGGILNHRLSTSAKKQQSSMYGTNCGSLPIANSVNDVIGGNRCAKKQTRILQAETDI